MPSPGHRLLAALEQTGYNLLEADRDKILATADSITDDWIDRVIMAFANNLPSGGVKNVEWGPIKGALLASEAQVGDATNIQVARLFDMTLAALKNAATH